MHAPATVQEVLKLADEGVPAAEIAHRVGISRSTIRTWLRGDLPRHTASADAADGCCAACQGSQHRFETLPREYVYLLGVYLGDGCIATHPRGVFKLRLSLDAAYPGIVDECERAIRMLMPANKVGRAVRGGAFDNSRDGGSLEVYSYSRGWPCLLPQHGPGRKHERPIVLTDWQGELVDTYPEALLRGLIHSDGCRFMNTGTNWRHPRYSFSNRSADIRGIFCDACDRLGLRWTSAPHTVYVSRKDDVAILDEHIGPKR